MATHDEHRQRLDKKVRDYGLDALEKHEQLEYILYAVIPRGDTNQIAHDLLDKFYTLDGVLRAEPKELQEIEGVGYRTAMFLSTLTEILGAVERSVEVDKRPVLDSQDKIKKFVKTYFYAKLDEAFYILSLTAQKRLASVSKISEGDEGETPAYIKKVAKKAVMNDARHVILVHNHPCGNVNPSISDVRISNQFLVNFEALGIEFLDSIIVSGKQCCSLKEKEFLTRLYKK